MRKYCTKVHLTFRCQTEQFMIIETESAMNIFCVQRFSEYVVAGWGGEGLREAERYLRRRRLEM